ncbi:MAG: ribbon-helix-helix domain-containing protein [Candidatus Competibacter sp.]
MSDKLQALQRALDSKQPKVTKPKASAPPARSESYRAPSREGKTNITAYLVPGFKSSLRLIQARNGASLQALVAEALNDLFAKYNVPTVKEE